MRRKESNTAGQSPGDACVIVKYSVDLETYPYVRTINHTRVSWASKAEIGLFERSPRRSRSTKNCLQQQAAKRQTTRQLPGNLLGKCLRPNFLPLVSSLVSCRNAQQGARGANRVDEKVIDVTYYFFHSKVPQNTVQQEAAKQYLTSTRKANQSTRSKKTEPSPQVSRQGQVWYSRPLRLPCQTHGGEYPPRRPGNTSFERAVQKSSGRDERNGSQPGGRLSSINLELFDLPSLALQSENDFIYICAQRGLHRGGLMPVASPPLPVNLRVERYKAKLLLIQLSWNRSKNTT